MCESKVQVWVKPRASALRASSTTRQAGGSVCRVTPKSILAPFLLLRVPPLAELGAASIRVQLREQDAVDLDRGSGGQPDEIRAPVGDAFSRRRREDLVGEADLIL